VLLEVNQLGDLARENVAIFLSLSAELKRLENRILANANSLEEVPFPLEPQTAAAVEAAIAHCVEPRREFVRKICLWQNRASQQRGSSGTLDAEGDRETEQRTANALGTWVGDLLVTGAIGDFAISGALVELRPSPIPSLALVSLVEHEWVDRHMLELAECAALLRIRCHRLAPRSRSLF